MPIRVTCPGCHTRFNVSEKFAGKDGPCPKCKKTITVPSASDEVKVHAPEGFGPKTTVGKAVFQPIARKETQITPVQMVLILAIVVGFLVIAGLIRGNVPEKSEFSSWILLLGAILLAVPCSYAGYSFLGDSELGKLQGQELWGRILICALTYGVAWLMIPLISYGVGPEIGMFAGLGAMIVIGAAAAYLFLQLDFLFGILHFGLFLGCCILLRVVAGFTALPYAESSGSKMDDILNAERAVQSLAFQAIEFCQTLV